MATLNDLIRAVKANLRSSESLDLNIYKTIFITLGFWPSDNEPGGFGSIFRKCLPLYLQFMTLYAGFIGKPMLAYESLGTDLSGTMYAIASLAIDASLLAAYACLLYRHEEIARTFVALEEMKMCSAILSEHPSDITSRNKRWSKWPLVYIIGCYALLFFSYFGLLNLYNKREFVYFQWYPFDERAPHTYPFVFVVTIITHTSTTVFVVAFFAMFLSLIIEAIGHLRLLSHNFRHILNAKKIPAVLPLTAGTQNASKSAGGKDENESTAATQGFAVPEHDLKVSGSLPTESMMVPVVEKNPFYAIFRHDTAEINCNIGNNLTIDQEGDLDEALRNCVLHHYAIIRFVEEVACTFNSFIFIFVLSTFIPSSFGVVLLIYAEELDTMSMTLCFALVVSNFAAAVCCWLLDKLTEESEAVREAVYDCDWFDQSESFKRSMRIIMAHSNQPLVVRVGGFISLSMETYYEMTKVTYTYSMAMWTHYDESANSK